MYCPKCKQTFEEGSRRFCPTDGARLVSEASLAARRPDNGIFSSLMSRDEAPIETNGPLSDVPRFHVTEPPPPKLNDDISGDFFVVEDVEPESKPFPKPVLSTPARPQQPSKNKPAARKVKPFEIPAGHAELAEGDRLALNSIEFRADDPEDFVGRTVKGRYQVTEFLGGDGGSFAFLADDQLVKDRMVLVRILTAEDDQSSDSILDDEIVALSHITHPNVARLIDSGQFNDGTRFLVTEYIDALSVSEILSINGQVDGQRTARIIRQIANALTEVHQEGVIHRDIRPENIIVMPGDDDTEQAVLVNFGASNGEANDVNRAYKAPEVFAGGFSTIASDIFSLAVVAYEMLTGIQPFDGTTSRTKGRPKFTGPERLPSEIQRGLPPTVDRVLVKAFAVNVADRYVKARDFGEAFNAAFAGSTVPVQVTQRVEPKAPPLPKVPVGTPHETKPAADNPAWQNRSPEPPEVENVRAKFIASSAIVGLLILLVIGWYYLARQPETAAVVDQAPANSQPAAASNTEMPPLPRNIPQPENTNFYQNTKQNLKGDLIRNFVGFTVYYPKDWTITGPQTGGSAGSRGKFLDISRLTPDGRMKEQMLVSYYPSKGTFTQDSDKFPRMVSEANDTLKKLLPNYQMISQGEIKVNGDWRAYEVKFQGSGTSENGETLTVWGRRLFIPAARPGVRSGFEITMLATSLADDVKSVNDVGARGELAPVLYSFEPSQNF